MKIIIFGKLRPRRIDADNTLCTLYLRTALGVEATEPVRVLYFSAVPQDFDLSTANFFGLSLLLSIATLLRSLT